jgi:hypothetical protein
MHKGIFAGAAVMVFFTCLLSCSDNISSPQAPEEGNTFDLSLPPTYSGPAILETAVVTGIDITPVEKGAALGDEHCDCLQTVDCLTGLPSSDFYRGEDGEVCIGFQWTLCDWLGGNAAEAIALYIPGTTRIPDYLNLESDIELGYLNPNPGGCYIMTTYVSYTVPPQVHGNFTLDWAQAVNYGTSCPPLVAFCGWPLSQPASPFTVHL